MMEMNFNNFTVSQLFGISDYRVEVLPSVSVSSKSVPSRSGTIFQGARIGERNVEVDIYLIQDYITQFTDEGIPKASVYQNYIRSIAYYLQTDEPCKLVFSDEPDRYLWAICTGIDMDRLYKVGQGTIKFLCNDPYYYATQENVFTMSDVGAGKFLIDNKGTVASHPKVTVNVQSDMNYLGIITPESVVQVGKLSGNSTAPKTYKYVDRMKTMNNWFYASQATMSTDCQFDPNITVTCTGEVMKPSLVQYSDSDVPQSPYNYKGTQMMTVLDNKYRSKYFNARLQFDFFSSSSTVRDPSQVGAIQIHLLDINNNVIVCCGMNDHDKTVELTNPYIKIGKETVWSEQPTLPTPTTKRYVKAFDNEDDLPADAKLVDKYEKTASYSTVTVTGSSLSVYNTYKSGRKVKTTIKNKQGTEYSVKTYDLEKYSNYIEIYLNSQRTSSGWVHKNHVTYNEPETSTMYVYERKIYPDKNVGKFTDLWGYFRVIREPHSNGKGDIWTFEMYRLKTVNGKEQATKLMSKKITDSTGTKYTHAGNIAKVAVTFVSRKDGKPISRMSFNHLEVTTINSYEAVEEPQVIASEGDVIEIDYAKPDVTLNGESILNEVDIGSRFAPLQPMMRTEMSITSDGAFDAEVSLTDKFL